MARSHLRVYYGPDQVSESNTKDVVRVTVGEILPTLVEAFQKRRSWLNDFENEEVAISSDLYEIILAYQHFRRPSA